MFYFKLENCRNLLRCVIAEMQTPSAEDCKNCLKGMVDCLAECSFNPIALATCSFCTIQKTILLGPRCFGCGTVILGFYNHCIRQDPSMFLIK